MSESTVGDRPKIEIENPFEDMSLSDRSALAAIDKGKLHRMLPNLHVMKIGGQSLLDRGRAGLYPLLDELVECRKHHEFCLTAGGGTRARHGYTLGLDLGLPTGVLAKTGVSVPRQNARILSFLLANDGGVYVDHIDFEKFPLYVRQGCIPITMGMPPYELWERPRKVGRIPANRTDSGTWLMGEAMGAKSVTYIKDEKGLYTADPKKDKNAKFIPKISVQELMEKDFMDLVIERVVLENMLKARHMKQLQIIDGLIPGNVTKALNGEHVGTIIYVDESAS